MLRFRTRTKWFVRKMNTGTRFQLSTKRQALRVIEILKAKGFEAQLEPERTEYATIGIGADTIRINLD